ncbi:hypothetical protein L3Q82_011486, partial [Scortum barcoo]
KLPAAVSTLMAKWGEGDPRWIVEERADATNVNNWHWTERDVSGWSSERLRQLLLGIRVEGPEGVCQLTDISKLDGEASINNRKGKLIFFYEWQLRASWLGTSSGGLKYRGTVEVSNLSDENDLDDLDISVSLCKDQPNTPLLNLMKKRGVQEVRRVLGEYIHQLKSEFRQGMILPTTDRPKPPQPETKKNHIQTNKTQISPAPMCTSRPAPCPAGVPISTCSFNLKETFQTSADELYRTFINQEPWVTPDLRALLQEKRTSFQSSDREELRRVQRDLKWKVKECKASYRRKMEDHLQQNNARETSRTPRTVATSRSSPTDTAIVGCVSEGNDCEYRKVIMDFIMVDWCELNHLQVNASKTKEMVIDFSRKPSSDIAPVNIQGLDIERVRTYKFTWFVQVFTRSSAAVDGHRRGRFQLLDGSIIGEFTQLVKVLDQRIEMRSRFRMWPSEHYATITLELEDQGDETELRMDCRGVPAGEEDSTREGWTRTGEKQQLSAVGLWTVMAKTKELTEELWLRIVAAHKSGKDYKAISKCFQVPVATVQSIIKKYKTLRTVENLRGRDRKPKVTPVLARRIVREVKKNPRITTKAILENLGPCWWQRSQGRTVQWTLRTKEDATSPDKAHKSLLWPLQMLIWIKKKTSGLLFYGQMKQKLNCFGHNDVSFIWCKKGEAFNPKNTIPTIKHGGGNLMLWGCFSANGSGNLITVNGTMKKRNTSRFSTTSGSLQRNLALGTTGYFSTTTTQNTQQKW